MERSPRLFRIWAFRRSQSLRRRALTGSPFWRAVAVAVYTQRFVRRQIKRQPEYLTTDKVLIGQALAVAVLAPTTRRDKRAARKAAKAAGTAS